MTTLFRRKAVAVGFAVLALTLAGGGIAVAQPPAHAPAEVVQPGVGQPGSGSQPAVTAAEARKAKAALAQGPSAMATTPGTISFAVVRGSTLLRGSPEAVSATRFGTGQYQVLFNYDVSQKGYVATIGTTDSANVPPAGEISVAPRLQTPNAVFIQTRNSFGTPADRQFHLVVAN